MVCYYLWSKMVYRLLGLSWLAGRRSIRLVRDGYVGWVSLDVNSSISDWLQSAQQGSHQLSLRVVVSDARSRTPLNTFQVFQSANCSNHQLSHGGMPDIVTVHVRAIRPCPPSGLSMRLPPPNGQRHCLFTIHCRSMLLFHSSFTYRAYTYFTHTMDFYFCLRSLALSLPVLLSYYPCTPTMSVGVRSLYRTSETVCLLVA